VCQLLDWDSSPWWPLWLCGALFIYNADRLRSDAADAVNVPRRARAMQRLRGWSALVAAAAASVLVAIPLLRGDGITLTLVLGGALVCLSYSVPILGWRLKDLPVMKTFFAPTIVAAAIFTLPWLHEGAPANRTLFALTAMRAWGFLLFNMILCDLRDIDGDRRTGTLSLPAALGVRRTRLLLGWMIVAIEGLTLAALAFTSPEHFRQWLAIAIAAPLYLIALLVAVRQPRSERFYEWYVEGMFFLPALATALF
jgi:4-hydroxybenzoate polyprenyltransferase